MENPQAQMPQGQPGQAPEQMQQGQPQEGGQDQQMQQVMQVVQQALQQGAQPAEVAAQLLQNQVPPELIMQVFVQLGMPQEEAQRNIEQAMQGGGEQPQGQGEEMMEGQASNPQEEQMEGSEEMEEDEDEDEEGQPKMFLGGLFSGRKNKKNSIVNNYYGYNPYGQSGGDGAYTNTTPGQMSFPSLASEAPSGNNTPEPEMNQTADYSNFVRDTGSQLPRYAQEAGNGFPPRFGDGVVGANGGYTPPAGYKNGGPLRTYQNGSDVNSTIAEIQAMLKSNVDPREIMMSVQSAAQQGKITPEQATSMMEELQSMQVASDPQGSDVAMGEGSQDPQQYDPNMQAPEQQMGMFGGNIKRNLKRAFGGPAVAPGTDSKNYAKDRTLMFTNSVKKDMLQATLNDSFPSLSGMAYGGLVKAEEGFDVTKYKTADEAELAARRYAETDPAKTFDWKSETAKWKEAAPTYKENINYMYDPVTKMLKENPNMSSGFPAGYNPNMAYNPNINYNPYGISPVSYGNPFDQYSQLYNQAAPWAKTLANLGNNRGYGNPMLSGSNLPGGMNAAQFLGSIGGLNGLTPGMAGKVGDQNWRVTGAEKYKKGSFWKGNRVKGLRYDIDWGDDAAMAAANGQNPIPQNQQGTSNYPKIVANAPLLNPDGSQRITLPTDPMTLSNPNITSEIKMPGQVLGAASSPFDWSTPGSNMPSLQNKVLNEPYTNPNISPEGELYSDKSPRDYKKMDRVAGRIEEKYNKGEEAGLDHAANPYSPYMVDRMDYGSDKDYYNARYPEASNRDIRRLARVYDNGQDPMDSTEKRYSSDEIEASDKQFKKDARTNKKLERKNSRADDKSDAGSIPSVDNSIPATTVNPAATVANPAASNDYSEEEEDRIRGIWSDMYKSGSKNRTPEEIAAEDKYFKEVLQPYQKRKPQVVEKAYGGKIDPQALQNAIHLINRAFGGMIPQAGNGLEVDEGMKPVGFSTEPSTVWNAGNQSTVGLLPESMQKNDNITVKPLPARPPKKGTVEAQEDGMYLKGIKLGKMAGASAQRLTNFANQFHAYDPNRKAAQQSSLNAPTNEFANMSQGLYGQQGDMLANDIGNNVLNPTNSNFANQQFVALGGRIYALGGEYNLNEDDVRTLGEYGYKLSRV